MGVSTTNRSGLFVCAVTDDWHQMSDRYKVYVVDRIEQEGDSATIFTKSIEHPRGSKPNSEMLDAVRFQNKVVTELRNTGFSGSIVVKSPGRPDFHA